MANQTINLNLIPEGVPQVAKVSQFDTQRTITFAIYHGTQRYTIPAGTSVEVHGMKGDNKIFIYTESDGYNAVSHTESTIVLTTTQQMTAAAGEALVQFRLIKEDENLGTLNFTMAVQEDPAAEGDASVSELPGIITQATEQMLRAEAAADAADDYKKDAEAWATGKKNGGDVGQGEEQYHNNAKYYTVLAEDYARNAFTSEQNAQRSATAAGTAMTGAETAQGRAEAAAARAEAAGANPPYIGANGHWWTYDTSTSQYVDSGVDASISVDIADITMLAPDATPYVTNTGTDTDPIFHLFIPRGKGISTIAKTSTSGLVDTYTVTYSDGATTTFQVTNGRGISTISKTSSSGLDDTYTIAYNDGTTSTFTVTNGKTAYQSAVEGGYTRTEQEFYEELGNFETWADNAAQSASDAAGSAADSYQSYLDAKNEADRAEAYADFVTPHFIIENNRLYIRDDAAPEFTTANNRLYIKVLAA